MKKLSALLAVLFASASLAVFAQATPATPAKPAEPPSEAALLLQEAVGHARAGVAAVPHSVGLRALLDACPRVKVLVTSRARLGLATMQACRPIPFADEQRIADQRPMTTPGDRLSAHRGDAALARRCHQLLQADSEIIGLHEIRVAAEARVAPAGIEGARVRLAAAAQQGAWEIRHPARGEGRREVFRVELRQAAGAGDSNPFVVGKAGYRRFLRTMDECLGAALARVAMVSDVALMLVYGDADGFQLDHVVSFYKLLGGALKDAGWQREHMSVNRLAILPGVTHYEMTDSPLLFEVVRPFLDGTMPGPGTVAPEVAR